MTGALGYDPARRPPQPPTPPPDAFKVHHAHLPTGVTLAYVHEGVGGTPLLLLHGYPETKRIWWRNIGPLADAGFEVIAPDLRGVGDSGHPPDDQHDIATYAKDMHALVADHLGHQACAVAAGDVGGVVATDLVHRFPGFVTRQCVFNTVPPMGAAGYAERGLDIRAFSGTGDGPTADYRDLQGRRPDELAAMLGSDDARRLWVAGMYTARLWSSPGSFDADDIAFMTEPFGDEARLRAGWAVYQLAHGRPFTELPFTDAVAVPTLILYGPDDHAVRSDFLAFTEVAYTNRIGPLVVPGAGHFLQWERADIFNAIVSAVLIDR
ncbi:alpha/beta hydrolase [Frankia sp. CNm7]|uniref:Alpha/beta hydrolase n=1 Tax=Frankia nepalensis TaxID=1836974 RepID=A0A937UMY3_9ACTN|nr:alpha/beta hydrolase [Frankia nepalensis]MBL7498478.1 alpha/beta hydrolase [Frankia nepalensis]MBL7509499.1 alpha/beta hydrolase [Frankia nepalensis]MBL7520758.1 alpha/beta hydrolase [Frankia nepalensis]MBL7629309.1 alpha/beta hydrolase [Frankia nepalensis]